MTEIDSGTGTALPAATERAWKLLGERPSEHLALRDLERLAASLRKELRRAAGEHGSYELVGFTLRDGKPVKTVQPVKVEPAGESWRVLVAKERLVATAAFLGAASRGLEAANLPGVRSALRELGMDDQEVERAAKKILAERNTRQFTFRTSSGAWSVLRQPGGTYDVVREEQ